MTPSTKIILALVVLPTLAFGQIDTVRSGLTIDLPAYFVALYDQYKADCYADSTKVDRCAGVHNEPWASGSCETCTDSTYTYCGGSGTYAVLITHTVPRFYWTHREATFDGFMEWLRKR